MAITYSQLVNVNGTIYNTATGKGYSTPDQLAADLGISSSQIQWGSIKADATWKPASTTSSTSTAPKTTTTSTTTSTAPKTTSGTGFTQFVKTSSSPTVYGQTSTGQWVAFETEQQFLNAGGSWGSIKPVSSPPSGAVAYTQYQTIAKAPTGVDPNLYNSLSSADKAFVQSMNTQAQGTYQTGQSNFAINAQTMQKALELAQSDPTIKAIYGDASKEAISDLQNNLGYLNKEYAQQFGLMTAEQAQQRKQLAEQYAGMGQAQSGFRQQAQDLMKQQQSGVIQSSQRQLQQQVRQLGSQYESQFGTQALQQLPFAVSAGGATYQPYNSITGSQPIAKQQAVEQKQQQEYQTISNPLNQ